MRTVLVERAILSNVSINFVYFFQEPTSMEVKKVNEQD